MRLIFAIVSLGLCAAAAAQDYRKWGEEQLREELERIADVTRKVNVEMRDGVHLSTDVYLPKDAPDALPTVFWRTPYNFNILSADELLPQAQKSLDYANDSFAEGETDILILLKAQERLLDTQRSYVSAQLRASTTLTELEKTVGVPLRGD